MPIIDPSAAHQWPIVSPLAMYHVTEFVIRPRYLVTLSLYIKLFFNYVMGSLDQVLFGTSEERHQLHTFVHLNIRCHQFHSKAYQHYTSMVAYIQTQSNFQISLCYMVTLWKIGVQTFNWYNVLVFLGCPTF